MPQTGVFIHEFMLASGLKLKGCTLLLYAEIYYYTINGQEMFKSVDSLAKRFDYTRKHAGKCLRVLLRDGLIIRSEQRHQPGNTYSYVANLSDPRCEISSHDNKRDRIEDNNINIHGKQYSLFTGAKIPAPKK